MANWSNDTPACVMTWVTCILLGQTRKPFPDAGGVKMQKLQYWAGSPEGRAARAQAFAVQMMHTFRDMFGAKYETGKSITTALPAMVGILVVKDNTLEDLAETNDEQFRFLEEN